MTGHKSLPQKRLQNTSVNEMERKYKKYKNTIFLHRKVTVHSLETIEEQQDLFWNQADFGYVKRMREGQVHLCKPTVEVCRSMSI